jgi:hypothetical protein
MLCQLKFQRGKFCILFVFDKLEAPLGSSTVCQNLAKFRLKNEFSVFQLVVIYFIYILLPLTPVSGLKPLICKLTNFPGEAENNLKHLFHIFNNLK